MKPHSMEEKISYRLFLMGFLGLLFTAALWGIRVRNSISIGPQAQGLDHLSLHPL